MGISLSPPPALHTPRRAHRCSLPLHTNALFSCCTLHPLSFMPGSETHPHTLSAMCCSTPQAPQCCGWWCWRPQRRACSCPKILRRQTWASRCMIPPSQCRCELLLSFVGSDVVLVLIQLRDPLPRVPYACQFCCLSLYSCLLACTHMPSAQALRSPSWPRPRALRPPWRLFESFLCQSSPARPWQPRFAAATPCAALACAHSLCCGCPVGPCCRPPGRLATCCPRGPAHASRHLFTPSSPICTHQF